jgi:hypothetical protein
LEVLPSMTIRRYDYFLEGVSFLTLDVLHSSLTAVITNCLKPCEAIIIQCIQKDGAVVVPPYFINQYPQE